jgi:hypothetical protein
MSNVSRDVIGSSQQILSVSSFGSMDDALKNGAWGWLLTVFPSTDSAHGLVANNHQFFS